MGGVGLQNSLRKAFAKDLPVVYYHQINLHQMHGCEANEGMEIFWTLSSATEYPILRFFSFRSRGSQVQYLDLDGPPSEHKLSINNGRKTNGEVTSGQCSYLTVAPQAGDFDRLLWVHHLHWITFKAECVRKEFGHYRLWAHFKSVYTVERRGEWRKTPPNRRLLVILTRSATPCEL